MQLRPYQSDLVGRVGAALAEHRSLLLQMPTGGGKTHVAAHVAGVAAAVGERVWILAHRREIVGQTSRSMDALGVAHGVVGAGRPFEPAQAVQVCAIGTLGRCADVLPPPDLMIWDEAHHVAAKSWATLRARFPAARHLGLTATPERLDGKGLGEFFARLICGPATAELMAAGHLSRYRLFAPTIPDLRGVRTHHGDFDRGQLVERMSGSVLVGDVVEHYRRHAPGGRAVAFAVNVEASRALAARFNAAGVPAAHIDGATPFVERDAAIADLEAGRIRVLSNVEVFTEGFDAPAIDAVILLRPSRSLALFHQMVGRGLRTAPGKGPTIILDHAGLFYEHGLPDDAIEWSLDGVKRQTGARSVERLRRCPECSAVHQQAPVCPECGHLYTAVDRTIREVYGELREVGPISGFDTVRGFARRIGKNQSNVHQLFRRGLPRAQDGFVPIVQALAWLKEHELPARHLPPKGLPDGSCESRGAFARRVGLTENRVNKLAARGLPVAPNGWVHIEPALAWIEAGFAERRQPIGDTVDGFAERVSATPDQVWGAKRNGLPLEADGSIAIDAALAWWMNTPRRFYGRKPEGFETMKAFCLRIGVAHRTGVRMLRRGLPLAPNGLVHIETGLAWVTKHGARIREPRPKKSG